MDKKREDLIRVREWLDRTFPNGSKRMASGSEENMELLIDPLSVGLVASQNDSDRGRLFAHCDGDVLTESTIYVTDSTHNGRYYPVNQAVGIVIQKADGQRYLAVIRMGNQMAHNKTGKWVNDLTDIPAAACGVCGGWTGYGGMSQYRDSDVPKYGRTGCTCHRIDDSEYRYPEWMKREY